MVASNPFVKSTVSYVTGKYSIEFSIVEYIHMHEQVVNIAWG